MIAAVVPAAGRGSRMGGPKLALRIGGRPMLERVITALRGGGVNPVVVVTGPHDPTLAPLARSAGAEVCELAAETPDMRSTVEQGLRWLEDRYSPQADDAFMLTPADLPMLEAATVRTLWDAWIHRGGPESILIPTCAGRRGHPALIAWRHVTEIRAMPVGVGIDVLLQGKLGDTQTVPVIGEGGIADIDTPADSARSARAFLT